MSLIEATDKQKRKERCKMAATALKRFFQRWFDPRETTTKQEEESGRPPLPYWVRRIAQVLALGHTRELIGEIDGEFRRMTPEARKTLIHNLILRFAYYVADLGASELHHHAKPFGLLDHSLEVALEASRAMSDPDEEEGKKGESAAEERYRRKYAGFVVGLLHDVGKCIDVSIQSEDGSEEWNPFLDGLGQFHVRHSYQGLLTPNLKYVKGRGLRGHEWRGLPLWRLILANGPYRFLGKPFLTSLIDAWVEKSFKESSPEVPPLAHQVVEAVCEADEKSTKADLAAKEGSSTDAPSGGGAEANEEAKEDPEPPEPVVEEHPIFVEREIDHDSPTREEFIYSFKQALVYVLRKGRVPVNRSGGVFVGSRYIFISWEGAMDHLYDSMRMGGCTLHWVPGDFDQIFEDILRYDGWLVSEKDRLCQDLVIEGVTPHGKKDRCAILKREVLEMDAPVFSGAITVYQAEDYERLSVYEIMKRTERGDPRMRYGGARRNAEERERNRVNLNPPLPERRPLLRREEGAAPPAPDPAPPVEPDSGRDASLEKEERGEGPGERANPTSPSREGEGNAPTASPPSPSNSRWAAPLKNELIAIHRNLKERQETVRARMKELVEEFKGRVKRSRLILFAKSRVKGAPISSLYWGILMKSKNGSEESKRWIKHVSTSLNDTLIYKVARKHKFKDIFYDFDRRRTALNAALHGAGEALTRIESSLVRRGKAPGQSAANLDKGSDVIEERIEDLVGHLRDIEDELGNLSSASKSEPFASRLSLEEPVEGEAGRPGDGRWLLSDGTVIESKVNRGYLEILGMGREEREDVMEYEVKRRKLRDLNAKAWGVVTRCRDAYQEAWPAGLDALKEGERVGVDRYGQPLEDGDEGLGDSGEDLEECA